MTEIGNGSRVVVRKYKCTYGLCDTGTHDRHIRPVLLILGSQTLVYRWSRRPFIRLNLLSLWWFDGRSNDEGVHGGSPSVRQMSCTLSDTCRIVGEVVSGRNGLPGSDCYRTV